MQLTHMLAHTSNDCHCTAGATNNNKQSLLCFSLYHKVILIKSFLFLLLTTCGYHIWQCYHLKRYQLD